MSRYRQSTPQDDPAAREGDVAFVGMRSNSDPEKLTPGLAQLLVNKTLQRGSAETRRGTATPKAINPSTLIPPIFGQGIYSDPVETEYTLLATAAGVWRVRDGHTPRLVPIPEPLAGPCDFTQEFNVVFLWREGLVPWQWSGSIHDSFVPVTQLDRGDGTKPIPNAGQGAAAYGRLFLFADRDTVTVSDVLDYQYYDEVEGVIRVNPGSDDKITRLLPWNVSSLLVFKDQSIFLLSGVNGALNQVTLTTINSTLRLGAIAGRSVAMVGSNVFFLAETGLYQVLQVIQDYLQSPPEAVSEPVENYWRQHVNWKAAPGACGVVFGHFYYLALPLDGSPVNNSVWCYNTSSKSWEGFHQWPAGVQLDRLFVADYAGSSRLHACDFAAGRVYVLHEGRQDVLGEARHEIRDLVLTRGYQLGDPHAKDFREIRVGIATQRPSLTVTAEPDGIARAEVLLPAPLTKSRVAYDQFGRPDWDPSNVNRDFATPDRQDYSVTLDTPLQLDAGVVLDYEQEREEPFITRTRGRWLCIRIENTQGSCAVRSVVAYGRAAQRTEKEAK